MKEDSDFYTKELPCIINKNLYFGCFSLCHYKFQNIEINKHIFPENKNFHYYIKTAWILLQLQDLDWSKNISIGFICGGYLSSIPIHFDPTVTVNEWLNYCATKMEIKNIHNIILNNKINFENLFGDLRIINLREVSIFTIKKIKLSLSYTNSGLEIFYNINYYDLHAIHKIIRNLESMILLLKNNSANLLQLLKG